MNRSEQLTAFQVELARIFFSLDAAEDYLVAGGAALLASDLIDRSTEDLDLFAATPTTSVVPARQAFMSALDSQGGGVVLIQDGPTFCRMVVSRAGEETLVDLPDDQDYRTFRRRRDSARRCRYLGRPGVLRGLGARTRSRRLSVQPVDQSRSATTMPRSRSRGA